MPVTGTYVISVVTMNGIDKGKLILLEEQDGFVGTLENDAGISKITNCKIKGNSIAFEVKNKTITGHDNVLVTGVIEGDTFSGLVKLPIGLLQMKGSRESNRAK